MSTNPIQAPGRSALWTEAALRALGGIAAADMDQIRWWSGGVEKEKAVARDGAAMAIRYATAFEAACLAAHEAEQEARRERVRAIGRFRSPMETLLTVERVEGDVVTFEIVPGEHAQRTATVEYVLDPECYEPAPLDAPAPTVAGGEERA